jgi:hypothetical protein
MKAMLTFKRGLNVCTCLHAVYYSEESSVLPQEFIFYYDVSSEVSADLTAAMH